ncbi:related to dihydrodipicolinate synthase [Cephalotrichum gorgonifer]|uniref:Related to dihydrodipicolinate synthase n=1 Tax=Cephalotrichum gorgonifer TaxID=2041049 RepID=A0AAE8SRW8_9PEZI|nr:related to dihydrodipicolinate synthase [Cephalotrichum gorgonifer]
MAQSTPSQPPPAGMYVPAPTFFASKTSLSPTSLPLDLDTQVAHSIYLARAGIRGIVLLGSTGEAIHLRTAERAEVLVAVRKGLDEAGFKDYPLIAGTASQNIDETVEQLEVAKQSGAGWGLVLAPGYFAGGVSQDAMAAWFTAVADRSPIPVMIYHYPAVSNNVKFLPSTQAKLSTHPNIVGCKLSHGDVSVHCQVSSHPDIDHSRFLTFTGLGQQLLPMMSVGGAGAIDGSAGVFPRTHVRLWELCRLPRPSDEEIAERRQLQYKVSCMEELVNSHGTVGIKEAASRLRGFGEVDGGRLPLARGLAGEGGWERWEGVISAVEEEEKRLEG